MFDVIDAILATLHLAVAGLAGCGPLLVAGLRLRRVSADPADDAVLRRVAGWSVAAVVLAAVLGLAAGAWRAGVGQGGYLEMLSRFPARAYWMVAGEWLFSLACYSGWLAMWNRWRQKPWRHGFLAMLGTTNLLYHFPLLMISQNLLVEQPGLVTETTVTRPLLVDLFHTPLVLAKASHIWAMSLLVAACAVLLAESISRSSPRLGLRRAAGIAGLVAMVVQMVSGVVVLACLPAAQTQRITGGSVLATTLLVLGVLLAIHLLMSFTKLALRPQAATKVVVLATGVVSVMLLMSLAARL